MSVYMESNDNDRDVIMIVHEYVCVKNVLKKINKLNK